MWGITRDGQGCHHLPPTPQPWGTRQTKVASSLDTMSTLLTTTLAPYRVIHLYQEPSTRVSAMEMLNTQVNSKRDYLKVELTIEDNTQTFALHIVLD